MTESLINFRGYMDRMDNKPKTIPETITSKALQEAWLNGWNECDGELKEIEAELQKKLDRMDAEIPGWRDKKHANGNPVWGKNGMLLNDDGTRSIFDDVDE